MSHEKKAAGFPKKRLSKPLEAPSANPFKFTLPEKTSIDRPCLRLTPSVPADSLQRIYPHFIAHNASTMSPSAIYAAPTPSVNGTKPSIKGPALAIGSLRTAEDGKYQSLITELEETRKVEKHLLDRLLDGGTSKYLHSPP